MHVLALGPLIANVFRKGQLDTLYDYLRQDMAQYFRYLNSAKHWQDCSKMMQCLLIEVN